LATLSTGPAATAATEAIDVPYGIDEYQTSVAEFIGRDPKNQVRYAVVVFKFKSWFMTVRYQ